MAKIINKPSALKREYLTLLRKIKNAVRLSFISVLLAVIGSVLMNYGRLLTFGMVLMIISVAGFISSTVYAILRHTDATVIKRGIEGEDAASEVISTLPEGYFGFQNVVITLDGKESELDLVVVGKTGVYIIETKNRNGTIKGKYNETQWTQHKVGQGGASYSNKFYSPVKQVGTHIFRLAHYLRSYGTKIHIDGIVYFSNPDATVEISNMQGEIPIITTTKELKKHILTGNTSLSKEEIIKICDILKQA